MKRSLTVCILTGLAAGLTTCQHPLDNFQLRVKDPIQAAVVEVRLYDPAGNPLPTNSQVKIVGPDAGQVVTTLNTTRYRINPDGVLLLAASPLALPSAQQPFRFTAVIEADGYLAVVQPVVLTGPNRVTRVLRQISLSKPPRTLLPARAAGKADAAGILSAPLSLTTTGSTPETDRASVLLPPMTRLTDRDGQAVGGTLTLHVLHTHTRVGDATSQVPGGGIMSNVEALPGEAAPGSQRMTSVAGSVTIDMYNEQYRLVYGFSQPARWAMDINPTTINAQAGRAVAPGDSIPLYSYDALLNRWQEETPGIVVRNPQTGQLEYQATASRTAAYVATWTEPVCDLGPVFKISSKLTNVDVNYRCDVVDAGTGQRISTFFANVNNDALIRVYNQRSGRKLKLQVYDETDAWGKGAKGGLIAESAAGESCDPEPVSINLTALPVPPVMKLAFDFICAKGTRLDESALPAQVITQYSEAGKEAWRGLITATRTVRSVTSYKLKMGRKYDFRASLDGGATWPLRQNNYLVDKPEWKLEIDAPMYCK